MPDHNAIQAFQNYALTKDAETCLARLRNIPPTSPEGIRALGVSTPILNWLGEVAGQFGCLIFIRATNPGVLEGVEQAHNTTGKPLTMKGKSSEIDAILSSIAFFAPLAKNVTRKWNESRKADIEHDQDNLLKIVNDNVVKTPDLSRRFIMGAGSGSDEADRCDKADTHTHTVWTKEIANVPTSDDGKHNHGWPDGWYARGLDDGDYSGIDTRNQIERSTNVSGEHHHKMTIPSLSGGTDAVAAGRPAWYALNFIMKL